MLGTMRLSIRMLRRHMALYSGCMATVGATSVIASASSSHPKFATWSDPLPRPENQREVAPKRRRLSLFYAKMTRQTPQHHPHYPFSTRRTSQHHPHHPFSARRRPKRHPRYPFSAHRRPKRQLRQPFSAYRTSKPQLRSPFSTHRTSQRHPRSHFLAH